MQRTVDFYSGVLGMPLTKTIDLPGGGQHFFFDCGNGDSLAFFWFPDAPAAVPGVSMPANRPDRGPITSAHGSMNHVAFGVEADRIDDYVSVLRTAGVECTEVANHDNSEFGIAAEQTEDVFVRSIYFTDPDGISLEIAAWTKDLTAADVAHTAKTAADAVSASSLARGGQPADEVGLGVDRSLLKDDPVVIGDDDRSAVS